MQRPMDSGVIDRLPVTFSSFCFDQMKDWDLLFPAEQSYFERLFALLDRTEVVGLFAGMRDIERKMGVTEKSWPKHQFTLEQVDFLNRNPFYPEWRAAVAGVFARIDPVLDAEVSKHGHARLVVVSAPSELPVGTDRMWMRIADRGKRVAVENPENVGDYLPLLLSGAPRAAHAPSITELRAGAKYDAWQIEAGESLAAGRPGVVRLSYALLDKYRKRLMGEVAQMVKSENIRGPRQLSARLKQMKVLPDEADMAGDAVLAEFVRASLLSGNGTLLINNTFVEWATVQAARRARPSVVVASFGVRNKVKPFSSLLIYADQESTTPIPTQMDTLGSYVDLEIFYQYLWQEFEKHAEYRGNTAYLFVMEGSDEMFVIAPKDFQVPNAAPLKSVFHQLKEWLA